MTDLRAIPTGGAQRIGGIDTCPPLAPMVMPKQVLTREAGRVWCVLVLIPFAWLQRGLRRLG